MEAVRGLMLVALMVLNDGLWCQSAMNVSGIGSWKLPDGSAVSDDLEFNPIHMANRPGQVGLLRASGIGFRSLPGHVHMHYS